MRKIALTLLIFLTAAVALSFVPSVRNLVSGILPLARPVPTFPPPGEELPFSLPEGFTAHRFASELPGVRVMVRDTFGNFWVSQPSEGTVSLLETDKETWEVARTSAIFRDLQKPHGLAIDPANPFMLYIAEEHRVSKVAIYSEGALQKIVDLPRDGGHYTRTLMLHPDGERLLVSIGSSCNVCNEADKRRATILAYDIATGETSEFAAGLRNTVFMTTHPVTGEVWGTDMGRDHLGDDLPPDEINILRESGFYGWPICYGKNVHDTDFDKSTYIRNPCMEPFETPSHIDIQAHSAPLGIAFVPEEGWPEEWWYDALVAYHGSWNRSVPTGYKIVRFPLDAEGNPEGEPVDFMTGFMTENGEVIGRPVDILVEPGGIMYVSDDRAGVIYRITRN